MKPSIALLGLLFLVAASPAAAQTTGQPTKLRLGPAEPLPKQLFVFNTDMLTAIAFRGVGYDSPVFENAVRAIRPQGLRFPGGTIANNYRWQVDSFSEPTHDKTGWAGEQLKLFRKIGRPYDLPGFARIARRHDLQTVWVLNVYEETPESVLALFEKLDELGLEITSVEMANEPYWDGRSLADVKSYIAASRPLAQTLRTHRPEVKIGACFAPLKNPANYEVIWNTPLSKETWFDAAVFHEYYGGQGFVLEKGESVSEQAMLHPEAMIDEPVAYLRDLMPDKPIWYTEWNIGMEGLDQWKNTGAELQYIAAMFVSLVDHRDEIDIACFHSFYDSRFGAFYIDDASGQVKKNISYQLFEMLGATFRDAHLLRPLVDTGDEKNDDLRGFATQQGDEVRCFVLNRGDTDHAIELPESFGGEVHRMTIDCTPMRSLSGSTEWIESSPVLERKVTLPAHSISVIGRPGTDASLATNAANDNLFPRRPDLTLWYEPYASEQPRFDADGVYVVDLGKFSDKKLAVVKMDLASSHLENGREYSLDLDAKTSREGGLVVKLPDADQNSAAFAILGSAFTPLRYTFTFDPNANNGEVTFVFTEEMIAAGGMIELRNFRIRATD